MEFKGTKGKWDIMSAKHMAVPFIVHVGNETIFQCYNTRNENDAKYNALLISKAPCFYEEILYTIDDLKILKANILDASKTNNRWDGMADVIQNWIDRKEQLIKQATEL